MNHYIPYKEIVSILDEFVDCDDLNKEGLRHAAVIKLKLYSPVKVMVPLDEVIVEINKAIKPHIKKDQDFFWPDIIIQHLHECFGDNTNEK